MCLVLRERRNRPTDFPVFGGEHKSMFSSVQSPNASAGLKDSFELVRSKQITSMPINASFNLQRQSAGYTDIGLLREGVGRYVWLFYIFWNSLCILRKFRREYNFSTCTMTWKKWQPTALSPIIPAFHTIVLSTFARIVFLVCFWKPFAPFRTTS